MDDMIHVLAKDEAQGGTGSLVILQTLLCLLREKNVLSRADIEELSARVAARAEKAASDPLPCCADAARTAASEMELIGGYIGRRYGGKHRRGGFPGSH